MILKNNNIIYKLYKGANEINKFDKDNIEAFIRIIDEYTPPTCPVVIPDIQDYQGSDPEVYSLADEKWYELNNLGQYEEYGIYETVQDLSTATYYPGKLVYYNNHQYESQNGQWVDLGEAGTSILIDSPSYIYNDSNHLFSINLGYTASTDTKFSMKIRPTENGGGAIIGDSEATSDQDDYRVFLYSNQFYFDTPGSATLGNRIYGGSFYNQDSEVEFGNYYIKNLKTDTNVATGNTFTCQRTSSLILGQSNQYGHSSTDKFQLSALTMYHGDTAARDFFPAIDNGEICLFDKVSGQFFKSDNGKQPLSGGTITQVEVGSVTPIHEYAEKEEIETEVTVSSLDEIECPFEGLIAIVDGTRYIYENGEWVEAPIDWSQEYLTFEAIEDGQFRLHREQSAVTCQYSLDNGTTWTTLADNVYTPTVLAGQKIKWKGNITPIASETLGAGGVGIFSATGRFNAMGNPYSMLNDTSFGSITAMTQRYALTELFRGNTYLISAENLSLPANVMYDRCYRSMFNECSNLVAAPELPATVMAYYCYVAMFANCTSLQEAPYLPATTLYQYCYQGMFRYCTSLNKIQYMSLTAPSSTYTNNWVEDVPSGGTFYKNANATWSNTFGVSAIPSGWTVIDA